MTIISLGAGVQSTVMALMSECGELPKADAAIFADTQWEPRHIYEHLDWLESQLSYPVYRVTGGNLRNVLLEKKTDKWRYALPFYMDGSIGKRQCTTDYKIVPIRKKVRELSGGASGTVQWIGITTDEASRMKPSGVQYITNVFPLIDLRMSRRDCEKWFHSRYPGRELRKSSCLGCPYHSDRQWREIRDVPEQWADVVEVDRSIRDTPNGKQYMHRSAKPIELVDFSTAEERGQTNLFENECEGMCGL